MGRVSSHTFSTWSLSPGCCGFRGVFWVRRGIFRVFFLSFFSFEPTRPAAGMRPPCFIYLSTSRGMAWSCFQKLGAYSYTLVTSHRHHTFFWCCKWPTVPFGLSLRHAASGTVRRATDGGSERLRCRYRSCSTWYDYETRLDMCWVIAMSKVRGEKISSSRRNAGISTRVYGTLLILQTAVCK